MVENLYRRVAERGEASVSIMQVIREAAAEVDRPLFYSVVVIVVSFLPIYVLAGPSGVLFKPMADTMIFALIGSLIVTLTLLPALCSWFMRKGVRDRRNKAFERIRSAYARGLDYCLGRPRGTAGAPAALPLAPPPPFPPLRAPLMPPLHSRAPSGGATLPH